MLPTSLTGPHRKPEEHATARSSTNSTRQTDGTHGLTSFDCRGNLPRDTVISARQDGGGASAASAGPTIVDGPVTDRRRAGTVAPGAAVPARFSVRAFVRAFCRRVCRRVGRWPESTAHRWERATRSAGAVHGQYAARQSSEVRGSSAAVTLWGRRISLCVRRHEEVSMPVREASR